MSKVTGVPMVELAVRIALGEPLADLGWPNGLLEPPPFVAVKAPAFSTAKLRGVDPSVGPGMQSTGEVIGISDGPAGRAREGADRRVARAAARRRRAGRRPPLALLSIADRDKAELPRLAPRAAPRRLPARGDAPERGRSLARGRASRRSPVAKLGAEPDVAVGEVAILELIASGEVRLVVNTPTPRSGAVRDAAEIRLAATAEGILCLTAIETAVAAAEALDPAIAARISEVRSLGEWVPNPGVPRRAARRSASEPVGAGAPA